MATLTKGMSSALPELIDRSDWIEVAGRVGFITRGAVHALIGLLTAHAAHLGKASSADTRSVITEVGSQPFGKVLLAIIALGFVGYAFFKFLLAIRNPEGLGHDTKGKAKRLGYAVVGFVYLALAYFAAMLALGNRESGATETERSSTILSLPGGAFILGGIGVVFGIVALSHFRQAITKKFMKHYAVARLDARKRKWLERLGQFGLSARGVTFALIGWFLVKASIESNPREVVGLRGAFTELARQPHGTVLLIVVALGFVAFGIYSISRGTHGRLRV